MDKRKRIREEETSVSTRELLSSGNEAKRKFLQTTKNICLNETGPSKRVCELKRRARSLKIEILKIMFARGRCKYTNDEKGCIKAITKEVERIKTELQTIDAMVRKQQQKLK